MKNKLDTIQCLRGIACLLVLLFHAALTEDKFWPHSDVRFFGWAMFGISGVNLFFVISGFIITWVTYEHIGKPLMVPTFIAKRVIRIYPVLWVAYGLLCLAMFFNIGLQFLPETMTPMEHVNSILLIPQDFRLYRVIPVSWTLVCEMMFYALFCALIALPRSWFPKALLTWAALILLASWLNWGDHSQFLTYALNPHNFQFIFGCVAAIAAKETTIKHPGKILASGCSLFVVSAVVVDLNFALFDPVYPKVIAFGVPAFLIVIGLVGLELSNDLRGPRLLLLLGNASYSIYIIHLAIYQAVRSFTVGVETPFGPEYGHIAQAGWLALLIAAGILGGLVLHYLVEKPIMDASSRYFARRRSSRGHTRLRTIPAEDCEQ